MQQGTLDTQAQNSEGAEFPNSIPDQDPMQITPSHDVSEEIEYDSTLDQMLMQSSKTSNGKSCPVHPHCLTSESPLSNNKQTPETSIMLAVLKHPCNVTFAEVDGHGYKEME